MVKCNQSFIMFIHVVISYCNWNVIMLNKKSDHNVLDKFFCIIHFLDINWLNASDTPFTSHNIK